METEGSKKSKTPAPKIIKFEDMLRNDSIHLYKPQKPSSNDSVNKSLNQSTSSNRKFQSRSVSKLNRSMDHGNLKSNPTSNKKSYSFFISNTVTDLSNTSIISDFTITDKENSDPNSQVSTFETFKEKIEEIYERSKVISDLIM
jgi:hypothetical protein